MTPASTAELDRRLFRLIARLHRAGLIADAELDELLALLTA